MNLYVKIMNRNRYGYIKADTSTTDEMVFHGLEKKILLVMIFLVIFFP